MRTPVRIAPAKPTVQLRATQRPLDRYVKLIARQGHTPGGIRGEDGSQPTIHEPVMFGGGKSCILNAPEQSYPLVGHCIYCGASEYAPNSTQPLGKEHILYEGIGGNLALPLASCQVCEGRTSATETKVLHRLFHPVRKRLGIRGKKKQSRMNKFKITAIVNEKEAELWLPYEVHPTTLFMPKFRLPGVIEGRPVGVSGLGGLWHHNLCPPEDRGVRDFAGPVLDTLLFCQLLAKTAHAFAVAKVGESAFHPFLKDFIRRKFEKTDAYLDCHHWVGGFLQSFAPSTTLHDLALMPFHADGVWYLMVHIRLFGNVGTPIYTVVVGDLVEPPVFAVTPDGRSVLGALLERRV